MSVRSVFPPMQSSSQLLSDQHRKPLAVVFLGGGSARIRSLIGGLQLSRCTHMQKNRRFAISFVLTIPFVLLHVSAPSGAERSITNHEPRVSSGIASLVVDDETKPDLPLGEASGSLSIDLNLDHEPRKFPSSAPSHETPLPSLPPPHVPHPHRELRRTPPGSWQLLASW